MIDKAQFADRQLELAGEFGKYVFAHPEVDDLIPQGAYIYFEVQDDAEFNAHSRSLAARKQKDGAPVVLVRVKGLTPPQVSRLIDPIIEPIPAA
jgi:hypothetical protein